MHAVTRIDRDMRPIFLPGSEAGGPDNEYPLVKQPWSGSTFGDLYVGGKVNLLSQAKDAPLAMALKAMVKLPTGSADKGTSSGQADFFVDYIVSKEVNEKVDISGYAGFAARADAERTDQSNGLRYGVGLGFPTRSGIKLTAELFGESYFDDSLDVERPDRLRRLDEHSASGRSRARSTSRSAPRTSARRASSLASVRRTR